MLKWSTPLPILTQNNSGGDNAELGTVSLFQHLIESQAPLVPLQMQLIFKQV